MRQFTMWILLLFTAFPAWSHDAIDARNRASLQVEVDREVANDWATARLSVVAEGKQPATVATAVNEKMKVALASAKRVKGVEVQSGAYVSQPVYDDARIVRWRARQELRVESGDVKKLSELIGTLQAESVLLSGIDFSVRPATRDEVEEELVTEALAAFRARSTLIAKGMGAGDWSLVALSVGRSGHEPRLVHARAEAQMMSTSKSTPPVFEAGTSRIRVQIEGTVELE
jgi:predicted secreted protein